MSKTANSIVSAPRGDDANLLSLIERVMTDPALPLDRVEQAFAFWQKVEADRARKAYFAAFAEMQPELPIIDRKGQSHNSKYGRWEDIVDQIMPVLKKHGFGISFRVAEASGKVLVTCVLMHKDGHSEETSHPYPYDTSGGKNAIQAIGSATSYGKRYTASALLNIVTRNEDDDGNAAGGGELISEKEIAELTQLITETSTDIDRFLKASSVECLSDLTMAGYRKARGLLLLKKRKAAK